MPFSFASAFLESFLPSKREGRSIVEYLKSAPVEGREISVLEEETEDWLLDEAEKEAKQKEYEETKRDPLDLFLHDGKWITVESSHVEAMRYLAEPQALYIEYWDGSIYQYSPVSRDLAEKFAYASSKGTVVWDDLRLRGTQFGFQIPYILVQPPTRRDRHWMRTQKSRLRHGKIGPSGF